MQLVLPDPDVAIMAAGVVRFMAVVLLIGGKMQKEIAGTGGERRTESFEPLLDYSFLPLVVPDSDFAVIHDEPFFTIVYEEGEFRGTVVDATLDRLERAREIASRYNLQIDHVRCDHYTNFMLHLTERTAPNQ